MLSHVWLCDSMDYRPPDFSVHGIFQSRILEWIAIPFSRGYSWPSDWTHISCVSWVGRWTLYHGITWETPEMGDFFFQMLPIHLLITKNPYVTTIFSSPFAFKQEMMCVTVRLKHWEVSMFLARTISVYFFLLQQAWKTHTKMAGLPHSEASCVNQ